MIVFDATFSMLADPHKRSSSRDCGEIFPIETVTKRLQTRKDFSARAGETLQQNNAPIVVGQKQRRVKSTEIFLVPWHPDGTIVARVFGNSEVSICF